MNRREVAMLAIAAAAAGTQGPAAAREAPPTTWDNLVKVNSKKLPLVYLAPGADFRPYKKIQLDPTEVSFHKDWARNYNGQSRGLSSRVSDSDIQKAVEKGIVAANDIFAEACAEAGYPVVAQPGPDVLRMRTGIINLTVTAPERQMAGRSRSYANEAGEATLFVEVRDSESGAILGRAVDRKLAGDNGMPYRNSMTNRSDFRLLVKRWAKISVGGLQELKALSPVTALGNTAN